MERLGTPDTPTGALRNILDGWFFTLEEDVLAEGNISPDDHEQLLERSNSLMEKRLALVTQTAPMFAVALRGYHTARAAGDSALTDGIVAWLAGQPNVAAGIKRQVGVKGDIDHFGAMSFLQGLLTVLRDSGHAGLYLVLDEVETIQRVRGDVRDKSLNALRQLIDDIDSGRFPGLYLLITGTGAFYDGPQGAQRLEPLAQRLHVRPASIIHGQSRSACRDSTSSGCARWARRSATSSSSMPRPRSESPLAARMPTSASWLRR